MIDLAQRDGGVILPVRAQPGSRTDAIRGIQDGALKVAVTQVAEKGKANKAVAAVICKRLGLKRSQLELVSGHATSHKQFLIRGLSIADLQSRIETALPS